MADVYYDDINVGDRYSSSVGRTITDMDNIWFTLLTNNNNQIHFNADYTKKYYPGEPFNGRLVVNGMLTIAVVVGLVVEYTSKNGFMLGIDGVKYMHPVFAGDTLYASAEVIEKRESRSKKGFGIIKIKTTGYNQNSEEVIEFTRTFMIPKKESKW
ncbi:MULTISPECIES: MaoC family dehydratase [Acidiplasma]|jgi:acyl dehydratase|uniref:Dehydratase n=1 Tax=Acidiplasma cupricumulans TaxID=312540 RepID=A0A0Q0RFA9_9ARCH|nr:MULTISPECIES: MaoC family dehydratase [Acidiplasma]KJE49981.1 dehydratase [Acidiplasma sp. MBA-1]KQB33774.1 dehydratase [Acidiplasma cupricumulans]WMT55180.1 MAG: MaoC family dehydratase [Acidiplasma sp.]